jgi:hypothetical protein
MGRFLLEIAEEAERRGYAFDRTKIHGLGSERGHRIGAARGQIEYEFELLKWKLERRDAKTLERIRGVAEIPISGIFERTEGGIASWEKASGEILGRLKDGDNMRGRVATGGT